jgi:hypothetical protein
MTPMPTRTIATTETIGKLCVGGDWACAHGDFADLRYVAQQLEDFVPEPTHCELAEIAAACIDGPEPRVSCAEVAAHPCHRRRVRGLHRGSRHGEEDGNSVS